MDRLASSTTSRAPLRVGAVVAATVVVTVGAAALASAAVAAARPAAITGASASVSSLGLACAPGGMEISLADDGVAPTDVVVEKDGTALPDVTIDADGAVRALVPMVDGETATITIVSGGVVLTAQTVTRHCDDDAPPAPSAPASGAGGLPPTTAPAGAVPSTTAAPTPTPTSTPVTALATATFEPPNQVLDASIEPDPVTTSGTLPVTGTRSTLVIAIAGLFLFAGGCFVVAARRQARS